METTTQNQRESKRVPANFSAMATYARHRIKVRIENLSRSGVYLQSPCYMNVHSIFGLAVKLPGTEETIGMYMTTCFIQKTGNGYGVGAYISGIATSARLIWEGYYDRLRKNYSASSMEVARVRHYRVALLYNPLPGPLVRAVIESGIELVEANKAADLERLAMDGSVDLILAELNPTCVELLSSFRKRSRLPARLVLLAPHQRPQDFTLGIGLGAERVIGMPCGRELFVEQLLQTLNESAAPRLSRDVQPLAASALEDSMSSSGNASISQERAKPSLSNTLLNALRWLLRTDPAPNPTAQTA